MHMAQESTVEKKNKGRKEGERERGKEVRGKGVRTDTAALTHHGTYKGQTVRAQTKKQNIVS